MGVCASNPEPSSPPPVRPLPTLAPHPPRSVVVDRRPELARNNFVPRGGSSLPSPSVSPPLVLTAFPPHRSRRRSPRPPRAPPRRPPKPPPRPPPSTPRRSPPSARHPAPCTATQMTTPPERPRRTPNPLPRSPADAPHRPSRPFRPRTPLPPRRPRVRARLPPALGASRPRLEHGGDPGASSFGWHASVPRVRVAFTVYVDGRGETRRGLGRRRRLPPDVADYDANLRRRTFAALGLYHPEARGADEKVEDAALVAAMDYVMDWAAAEHKVGLDPYRDIGRVRCVFDLVQPGGRRVEHTHAHEGGPDDRMNAFRSSARRVSGW